MPCITLDIVIKMADIAVESFEKAISLFENYNASVFDEVNELEGLVDKYEDKISTYLVRVAQQDMSQKDSKVVTELLHCIGDIERISDHALNIAEAAKEISDKNITFSDKANEDLLVITNAVSEILELSVNALKNEDVLLASSVEPLEQVIDHLKRQIKNGHISRLRQGDCTMELGFVLSDLLTNYERISDHCSNIAVCFIETTHESLGSHEYLNQIKSKGDSDFARLFEQYKEKYNI